MFNFKAKKEEKARQLAEQQELEKRQHDMEAKLQIKKTLADLKRKASKMDGLKNDYIEKGKKALLMGNTQTYNLAKSGLKLCLSKQKILETMIANFEISMQINDTNKIIGDFVSSINIISEQMKSVTSPVDMLKAQTAYEKAMENNEGQFQALNIFLDTAAESIESYDGIDSSISDDEIDALMQNNAVSEESSIDNDIDEKIKEIQAKLNS